MTGNIQFTRIGPVYLWWSEHSDEAVIGPKQGAWGGDDIFKCDSCPDWETGEWPHVDADKEAIAHAQTHGFDVDAGARVVTTQDTQTPRTAAGRTLIADKVQALLQDAIESVESEVAAPRAATEPTLTRETLAAALHSEISHYGGNRNPQTETHRTLHLADADAILAALGATPTSEPSAR